MKKVVLAVAAVLFILLALLVGGIKYRTEYAKTEIVNTASEDGNYTLIIYMIGEPDWPFGSTHCRFDLLNDGKRIVKLPFDIQDDGANAHESNFNVIWEDDNVTIIVSGSEQGNNFYRLSFSGDIDYW